MAIVIEPVSLSDEETPPVIAPIGSLVASKWLCMPSPGSMRKY